MRRLVALVPLAALLAAIPYAGAATRTVRIERDGFRPVTHTIDLDDTVRWRNADTVRHQVVAESGAFASPVLQPGQTWSFTFTAVGRYAYRDALEPSERGVVVVRAPARAVSLAANPTAVVYGGETALSGAVSNRRQGERVEVFAHPHGAPAPVSIGVVTTAAGGTFALAHRPTVATGYSARWGPTTSAGVGVGVRPRITFRRTSNRKRFVIRLAAERPFAGRWVYLQRRSRLQQWVNVRRVRLGPRSGKIFDLPRRAGRYRVFLTENQAGAGYLASWSGVQRVRR
ncbi:MAG: hypothetical protein ICV64_02270 [Thermoleophilia bacterium]|nr:hypothetical protein [Thermoleophilia bacterium]